MKLQQFDPKIISITQLRRDIDVLEQALAQQEEALVMRNQSLLFVAITPERYQKLAGGNGKINAVNQAVAAIGRIRNEVGGEKRRNLVSDYVSKMREKRIQKWTKSSRRP